MYTHSPPPEEIADIASIDCTFLAQEPIHFNSLTHRIISRAINVPPVYFVSKEGFDITSKEVGVFQHIIGILLHQSKKSTKKYEALQVELARVEAERNEAVAECVKCYDRIRKLENDAPNGKNQYIIDERKYHHRRHRNHIVSSLPGGITSGNQSSAPLVVFSCTICGNTYPTQHSLLSHTTKRHAGVSVAPPSASNVLSSNNVLSRSSNPCVSSPMMGLAPTHIPSATTFAVPPVMETTGNGVASPTAPPFSSFSPSGSINTASPVMEVQRFREELGQVRQLVEEVLHKEQVTPPSTLSVPSPTPPPTADLMLMNQLTVELKKIQEVLQSSNNRLGQMEAVFSSQGYLRDEFEQQQKLLQQFQDKQDKLQDLLKKINQQDQKVEPVNVSIMEGKDASVRPSALTGSTGHENVAASSESGNRISPPAISTLHNEVSAQPSPAERSNSVNQQKAPLQLSSLTMLTEKDLRDILETCVISPMSNFTDRSATVHLGSHPHIIDPIAHSVSPSPSVQSVKNMSSKENLNNSSSRGPSRVAPNVGATDNDAQKYVSTQDPTNSSLPRPIEQVGIQTVVKTPDATVVVAPAPKSNLNNTLTNATITTPIQTETSMDATTSVLSMATPPAGGLSGARSGTVPAVFLGTGLSPDGKNPSVLPPPPNSTSDALGLPFVAPASNSRSIGQTSAGQVTASDEGTGRPFNAGVQVQHDNGSLSAQCISSTGTDASPCPNHQATSVPHLPTPPIISPEVEVKTAARGEGSMATTPDPGCRIAPPPVSGPFQTNTPTVSNITANTSPQHTETVTQPVPSISTTLQVPPILLSSVMDQQNAPLSKTVPSASQSAGPVEGNTPPKGIVVVEERTPSSRLTPNKVVSITPDTTKRSNKTDEDELLVDRKPTSRGSMTPQSLSPSPRNGSRSAVRPSGGRRPASATSSSYYYTYSDSDSSYTDSEDVVQFQRRVDDNTDDDDEGEEDEVSRNEPQVGSEERDSLFIESLSGTDCSGRKVNLTDLTEKKKKSYGIFKKMFSKK